MKRILSIALACILMLAILTPCMAAEKTAKETAAGTTVTLGAWPQSRVTDPKETAALSTKLRTASVQWQLDVLPDGSILRYCDVDFLPFSAMVTVRPSYRAVRIDGGSVQWYRWEPLTWEWNIFNNVCVLICTSVVYAAPYSGANPVAKGDPDAAAIYAFLTQDFYNAAFTDSEKCYFYSPTVPLYSLTNGSAAAVSDYAALYGASGSRYLQMLNPEPPVPSGNNDPICSSDTTLLKEKDAQAAGKATTGSTAKSPVSRRAQADVIGIRPMLIASQTNGGGLINWLLRLFGW